MSNKIEQALEAAIHMIDVLQTSGLNLTSEGVKVKVDLESALAEIVKCEAVAYVSKDTAYYFGISEKWETGVFRYGKFADEAIPLYTSPQPREWVGLSDQDIRDVYTKLNWTATAIEFEEARAIEIKLKQLNKPEKG